LPREAQVVGEVAEVAWVFVGQGAAKGFGFPRPDRLVVAGPCDFPGRCQVVGVDVEDIYCSSVGFQYGNGQAAQPDSFLEGLPGGIIFALQLPSSGGGEQGTGAVDVSLLPMRSKFENNFSIFLCVVIFEHQKGVFADCHVSYDLEL
jgi:hypothetical protein